METAINCAYKKDGMHTNPPSNGILCRNEDTLPTCNSMNKKPLFYLHIHHRDHRSGGWWHTDGHRVKQWHQNSTSVAALHSEECLVLGQLLVLSSPHILYLFRSNFLKKTIQSALQNNDYFSSPIMICTWYVVLPVIFLPKVCGPKLCTNYVISGTWFYSFPLCCLTASNIALYTSHIQWKSY